MIPATNALLSLLVLKLLDKERLSHIDDFNCDEALSLFAGLNILPMRGKAGPSVLTFFAMAQKSKVFATQTRI